MNEARRRLLLVIGSSVVAFGAGVVLGPRVRKLAETAPSRARPPLRERPLTVLPPSTFVFLVLGQSNAANHGETRHRADGNVFAFDGKLYEAEDPLPGATGDGGS